MTTETIRLIDGGVGGWEVWRLGEREIINIIYLSLHCHHKNDFCIKMGSDETISNFLSLVLSVLDDIDRADCTQPSKVTGILFVAEARKVILLGVAHHQKITLSSPKYHLLTCICYSSILTFSGICEWIQLRACPGKKAGERETQRGREREEKRVIYHNVKLERLGNTLIVLL